MIQSRQRHVYTQIRRLWQHCPERTFILCSGASKHSYVQATYQQSSTSRARATRTAPISTGGPALRNLSGRENPAYLPAVQVSIRDEKGNPIVVRTILRSFPKANPTKLIAEAERLLSSSLSRQQKGLRWFLAKAGKGVYTTLLIPEGQRVDNFLARVQHEADLLQHHPHVSRETAVPTSTAQHAQNESPQRYTVMNILCTTHRPAGLSMKDIRLASAINRVVSSINNTSIDESYISLSSSLKSVDTDTRNGTPSLAIKCLDLDLMDCEFPSSTASGSSNTYATAMEDDSNNSLADLARVLLKENLADADAAVSNPASLCATTTHTSHATGKQSSKS